MSLMTIENPLRSLINCSTRPESSYEAIFIFTLSLAIVNRRIDVIVDTGSEGLVIVDLMLLIAEVGFATNFLPASVIAISTSGVVQHHTRSLTRVMPVQVCQ